jgi:hypothetical protein
MDHDGDGICADGTCCSEWGDVEQPPNFALGALFQGLGLPRVSLMRVVVLAVVL